MSALPLALVATAVNAQTPAATGGLTPYDKGWTGEASLSGNVSTGNTQATEIGSGLKLGYEMGLWRHALAAAYDFGTASGSETKNRGTADYQVDRLFNERLFAYGRAAYENDRFSGYDYRGVVSAGLGVDILRGDVRSWNVRGGPGLQIDRVGRINDAVTGALISPADATTKGALSLGSRFAAKLNENVSLTNDSSATIGEDTTALFNSFAVTSELTDHFALRVSFDVAHNTNPPVDAKETDTVSRASLVYAFGK